ncbi:MAG TPA: molybdopterin-dependent oxidoreductase, partial [Longimicrobiales bacterium]|nr:molybdopterin-dependent oxidoreductase [Longimicrobiales bacterium]
MRTPRTSITRREAIARAGGAAAALALMPSGLAARLDAASPQEAVVPWLDALPAGGGSNQLDWQALTSWATPTEDLFRVQHYNVPELSEQGYTLRVGGLVERPLTFTMEQLRARPRREVVFTLECAGNRGFGTFMGAVHNARWAGTPLAPILEEAGIAEGGVEVVFFGADEGEEEIRGTAVRQNFARSMSIADATSPELLLAWEVNGEPLPVGHGFPLRLVAPGWYGVANVKWLTRIEVWPTRFAGRFMARDYVTLRQVERDGEMVWVESSVGRGRINSMPARVTRNGSAYRIHGAAWGADVAR